jgi:hypothetical protein
MEDLLKITKNYYQKTESEKQVIKQMIYDDMIELCDTQDLGYVDFIMIISKFADKMIEDEKYEIADLLKIVSNEVEKKYYKVK